MQIDSSHPSSRVGLQLNDAELNSVRAGTLIIGDASSGAVQIQSALEGGNGGALAHVTTALSLNAASTISQQAGATIDRRSAGSAQGLSVTLTEAYSTGVVSACAFAGNFSYNTTNNLTVSSIAGNGGLTPPARSCSNHYMRKGAISTAAVASPPPADWR